MEMTPELSRLAKMLIDADGITETEAEARLRGMTLEIVVGNGTQSTAAHNAILTAVAVGQRTFVGGVRVILSEDAELASDLPIGAASLKEAVSLLGAVEIARPSSARIVIGEVADGITADAFAWWDNWRAGSSAEAMVCRGHDNPLVGIIAGAATVAQTFASVRNVSYPDVLAFDLWPNNDDGDRPSFGSVFLPGALWVLGLGNLGQAILWSLSSLPYARPHEFTLVVQDRDRVTAGNWGTSVLVRSGKYGGYKTAEAEAWGKAKGFDVRRIDRWLDGRQHVQEGDPLLAVCGFDSINSRKHIDTCGFEAVIDAGLGRKHTDFDVYRITIFDEDYRVASHFNDNRATPTTAPRDYEKLLGLDKCGAAVFDGMAIAAPFVSAVVGALVVARTIAISSGISVPRNEVRRLSREDPRFAPDIRIPARGLLRIPQTGN